MIDVSARASGSVITDMMNRAADKPIKAALPHITATIVASRETGLRNSTVNIIIVEHALVCPPIHTTDRLKSVPLLLKVSWVCTYFSCDSIFYRFRGRSSRSRMSHRSRDFYQTSD